MHLARFAVTSELDYDGVNNAEKVKRFVSGGDTYHAREICDKGSKMKNMSTWFVFTNNLPKISGMDDAMRVRVGAVITIEKSPRGHLRS